jgi:xanthine dehydrogenase accessory factor
LDWIDDRRKIEVLRLLSKGLNPEFSIERLLRATKSGSFLTDKKIGDSVQAGEVIAYIDGSPVEAQIDGIIRGLLRNETAVQKGMKVGDIDPRGIKDYCFTISDKARAITGGVLEAILSRFNG